MFFISQTGKQDCGFACLEMLLANFNKDKNYLYLRHEDKRYTFRELISFAKNYNMKLLGVKVLDTNELLNCNTFPFIAVIKNKEYQNHSILVTKINKRKVTFYDPQFGKRKISFAEFVSSWTKLALIVEAFTPTKCDIIPPSFVDKKDKIILPLFGLGSGITLLSGTFFLSVENWFYLPIIFFSLFIVFEILYRSSLLKAMDRIDDKIYSCQINKTEENYLTIFETIQKYRFGALSLLPNLISSLMVVIFITIIMVLNSFWNVLYITTVIIFAIISYFFIKPKFKHEECQIIESENMSVNANNDYEFSYFAKRASEKASSLGLKKTLFKYFEIAILLILSIVVMYIIGVVNITYVIFYLCINVFLSETTEKIFEYANKKDEFDSLKGKLINYLK